MKVTIWSEVNSVLVRKNCVLQVIKLAEALETSFEGVAKTVEDNYPNLKLRSDIEQRIRSIV